MKQLKKKVNLPEPVKDWSNWTKNPDFPDYPVWKKWTDNNCEPIRYRYNLNSKSVCFDLGAFHCEWSIKISDMYNKPTIYAFEPVPSIYEIAKQKITGYDNIKLFPYGLGNNNYELDITMGPVDGVSSSFFIDGETKVKASIRSVKEVFEELGISNVDLMKINIEGSEYDVLDCLIENNLHTKIANIQVQFHRLGEDYNSRINKIKEELRKSHHITYEFPFVWENWKSKWAKRR